MRMLPVGIACLLALAGWPAAHAQKATEQFIPVGQSPGVSGKLSWIGEIVAVDAAKRTLTLRDDAGEHTVKLGDGSRIYLDRSKLKQRSLAGSFADLVPGRRAEVKYVADQQDSPRAAEWVKVEISEP